MPTPLTDEQATKLRDDTAELQKAYLMAFAGASGEMVLADLARFCRANEPCFMKDDRYHALLEGRREVWLRIQNELKLPIEELLQRRVGDSYYVVKIEPEDEDNG